MALNMAFSFQKADLEASISGKVSIWNLSPAHRAMLETADCALSLQAGYRGRTPLIFTGIVTFAGTVPDGADRVTECEIVDTRVEVRETQVSVGCKWTVNGTLHSYTASDAPDEQEVLHGLLGAIDNRDFDAEVDEEALLLRGGGDGTVH